MTIPEPNSISLPNHADFERVTDQNEQQHVPRKLAVLNRRTSRFVVCFPGRIRMIVFFAEHNKQRKVNFNLTKATNQLTMILFMLSTEKTIHSILFHSNEYDLCCLFEISTNICFPSGSFDPSGNGNKSNTTS